MNLQDQIWERLPQLTYLVKCSVGTSGGDDRRVHYSEHLSLDLTGNSVYISWFSVDEARSALAVLTGRTESEVNQATDNIKPIYRSSWSTPDFQTATSKPVRPEVLAAIAALAQHQYRLTYLGEGNLSPKARAKFLCLMAGASKFELACARFWLKECDLCAGNTVSFPDLRLLEST